LRDSGLQEIIGFNYSPQLLDLVLLIFIVFISMNTKEALFHFKSMMLENSLIQYATHWLQKTLDPGIAFPDIVAEMILVSNLILCVLLIRGERKIEVPQKNKS
jgi:hypothetical protein